MTRPGNRNYQPNLCLLEDRTLPSGFRVFTGGPAAHLMVIAPQQVQAGQTFTIKVEAVDAANRVSGGFTGPVQLSLGNAVLASYTYTKADAGIHLFQIALPSVGSQSIGALDTAAGSTINGGAVISVKPGAVTHFDVSLPNMAAVGAATSFTVEALDAYNNVATNFTGAVHLSAAGSVLPANYTFVAADHGTHTFNVTFTSAGFKTVCATAAANTAINGQASLMAYVAGLATHFSITVLGPVIAGVPTIVQVTALDAGNQVATGYLGVVHFASSDAYASLLGDYGFTSSDQGSHLFSVIFAASGTQIITATDTMAGSITGAASAAVLPSAYAPYYGWGWGTSGWGWY
jgi:hypothetical protein